MVANGTLPSQELIKWRLAEGEAVPMPLTGEVVVFTDFFSPNCPHVAIDGGGAYAECRLTNTRQTKHLPIVARLELDKTTCFFISYDPDILKQLILFKEKE